MSALPSQEFTVDPAAPSVPANFPLPPAGSGEVVLLLAESEARASGWAAAFALEVAREWAARGRPSFLADGDFADAPLHGLAGVANGEGLSDLLHFGLSPARVARPTDVEGLVLVSAGTPVADSAASYRHSRWSPLLRAFRESGSLFLLYLPSEHSGIEALLAEGDRVFRLTEEEGREEELAVVRVRGVRSGARPSESVRASDLPATSAADLPVVSESDLLPLTPPPQPGIVLPPRGESVVRPPASRTHPPVWLLLVLVALVAALLVAARFGLVRIPGVTPEGTVSLLEGVGLAGGLFG